MGQGPRSTQTWVPSFPRSSSQTNAVCAHTPSHDHIFNTHMHLLGFPAFSQRRIYHKANKLRILQFCDPFQSLISNFACTILHSFFFFMIIQATSSTKLLELLFQKFQSNIQLLIKLFSFWATHRLCAAVGLCSGVALHQVQTSRAMHPDHPSLAPHICEQCGVILYCCDK